MDITESFLFEASSLGISTASMSFRMASAVRSAATAAPVEMTQPPSTTAVHAIFANLLIGCSFLSRNPMTINGSIINGNDARRQRGESCVAQGSGGVS